MVHSEKKEEVHGEHVHSFRAVCFNLNTIYTSDAATPQLLNTRSKLAKQRDKFSTVKDRSKLLQE